MLVPKSLLAYLDGSKATYEILKHRVVYTAFDRAATLKIKITEVAKTLLLKTDKQPIMAVLSAGHQLDLARLAKIAKAKKIRIPSEKDIMHLLKMKRGSILSFASRYRLPLFLDKQFKKNKHGIFSCGTFSDSIKMPLKEFIRLEQPRVGSFGIVKKIKKPKLQKKKVKIAKKAVVKKKKISSKKPKAKS